MHMNKIVLGFVGLTLLLPGCGSSFDTMASGTDAGDVGDSGRMDATTSVDGGAMDVALTEAAPNTSDAGMPSDTGASLESGPSCAGTECTSWASALSAASTLRGASGTTADQALANCVVHVHRSECCGAQRAYGFNHAARTQLCTAESACTAMYPASPGCTSTLITTDSGEMTTNVSQVRLRVVNPTACTYGTCYTCQTFVCAAATCMTAPGITPMQCG
jgi:hypothetical protein